MKTAIIKHAQGSQQWHAHRASHFNASDAAAMLGISAYKTRNQLLREKATGLTDEVDAQTQARFDKGHEYEALARPWAEEIIGAELYPVVLAGEHEDMRLSASLDGLTMLEDVSFEHKSLNADLSESLDVGEIPAQYHPQLEMGLMLSGAERCLFMASSGIKDELRYAWYEPDLALRERIVAGWHQFAADLASYTPTEVDIKPAANTAEALPSVSVQVSGAIAIRDNLPAFEVALRDFIDNRLIRNPETDQDFANLESQIKALKNAEVALDAAEAQMLAQVESVDAAKRMKDMLHKLTRDNRLMAEKLLAARKDTIRAEIVADGRNSMADHINALNDRIGRALMPPVPVDFAGVIKGKRTLDSMRDAVGTELARCKIEANAVADRITINLRMLNEHPDLAFLFSDVATLALKETEFVAMAVKNRIAEHQAIEAARIEAERQRIATQERIKAEAAAQARADAEIAAATAKARAEAQADAEAKRASDEAISNAAFMAKIDASRIQHNACGQPVTAAVEMRDAHLDRDSVTGPPTLKLGQIAERLSFQLTADFLRHLGFEPAAIDKNARLYHDQDFSRICAALVRHIQRVAQGVPA